jgi:signal peptidase I
MTVKDSRNEESLPRDVGAGDVAVADREAPSVATVRNGPAPARRVDYRLRGLDFDGSLLRPDVAPPTIHKKHPSRVRRRRRLLLQWLVVLAVLVSTTALLRVFVVQPYTVRSTSMVPNIQAGTNVLVLRPSSLTGPIKLGNVIVFHQPKNANCSNVGDGSQDFVNRVIGLPGQTIWSEGQRIYIDGRLLSEAGWYNVPFGELGPTPIARTTIPSDSYFVMGDNRTDPCDSRSFGPIRGSSIVGKVIASTWRGGHPFAHFV